MNWNNSSTPLISPRPTGKFNKRCKSFCNVILLVVHSFFRHLWRRFQIIPRRNWIRWEKRSSSMLFITYTRRRAPVCRHRENRPGSDRSSMEKMKRPFKVLSSLPLLLLLLLLRERENRWSFALGTPFLEPIDPNVVYRFLGQEWRWRHSPITLSVHILIWVFLSNNGSDFLTIKFSTPRIFFFDLE